MKSKSKKRKLGENKMGSKIKNTSIPDIFNNMEYGESFEKVDDGIKWIKNKESTFFAYIEENSESVNGTAVQIENRINGEVLCTEYVPAVETITKILTRSSSTTKWIDTNASQRSKLLYTLADEIGKNADLLLQIEIVSRGILGKDTRNKAIPLLARYFQYYSSFAVKYNRENPNWKPEGIAVGIISNENVLSNVGLMLAPALAAGYNIVLQVGTTLFPAVAYIIELANNLGVPEDVIRLIPSDQESLMPYFFNTDVIILTLLVDLNNEKYVGLNNFNRKILNLSCNKIPAIIFDNADLDSASTSIIESAWGYQGLLPWSVDTVLVQENVFGAFVNKLKTKVKNVKVGLGNNRMADISETSKASVSKLNQLIKLAKVQGIEIFQSNENFSLFTPTLFIGGKVNTNRVIRGDDDKEANAVTVLAFRSIDEAVNLANNSRQGLAASVWTENVGVVNEVSRKLKVSNVWINTHGLTAPEIPISPVKDSGVGYFGGKEGFYEYVQVKKLSVPNGVDTKLNKKIDGSCENFVNFAKKSQASWCRLSKINKAKILQKLANYIESEKKDLSNSVPEVFLDEWISETYQCLTEPINGYISMQLDFNVVSMCEPLGVVAVENDEDNDVKNIRLILAALFEGNAIVLLTRSTKTLSFYNELSSRLPPTILTVLSYNFNNIEVIAAHKELAAYFGGEINPVYRLLPVKESKIYTNVSGDWNDVHRKVTFMKNVWVNIGKSCTCSLFSY